MANTTNVPTRKVAAGGLAGAIVTVIMMLLAKFNPDLANWPDGFEAALTTIISFAVSYLTPPAAAETVVTNAAGAARSATATT